MLDPAGDGPTARLVEAARRRPLAAVAGVVVLALVLGLLLREVLVPRRTVPDLAAQTRDAAVQQLAEADLEVVIGPGEPSRDVPLGSVVRTQPVGDARLRAGDPVTLIVSTGPPLVGVPELTGRTEAEAVQALDDQELRPRITRAFSRTGVAAGTVEAQDPGAGAELPVGSEVAVTVSQGVEQVEVPDVTGGSLEEARRALAADGFGIEVREEFSDTQPRAGEVLRQAPRGGGRAPRGDVVQVVVSAGPASVTVPNLWMATIEDARAALEALGLRVRVDEQPPPRLGPIVWGEAGLVEAQDPAPGVVVRRGTQITLTTWSDVGQSDPRQAEG